MSRLRFPSVYVLLWSSEHNEQTIENIYGTAKGAEEALKAEHKRLSEGTMHVNYKQVPMQVSEIEDDMFEYGQGWRFSLQISKKPLL